MSISKILKSLNVFNIANVKILEKLKVANI